MYPVAYSANADRLEQRERPSAEARRTMWRLFSLAATIRISLWLLVSALSGDVNSISRDSMWYDIEGQNIALQYQTGDVNWSLWIDDGWFQFIGLCYYLLVPSLTLIVFINSLLAGGATVLTYRIAASVFGSPAVAKASALTFALFPGAVFFHSLPLKECAACFSAMLIVWGILQVQRQPGFSPWLKIVVGILIIAALRVYLVPVFIFLTVLCVFPIPTKSFLAATIVLAGLGYALLLVAVYLITQAGIRTEGNEMLQYFDIERINQTRMSMSRGKSKIFADEEDAQYTGDVIHDVKLLGLGIFHFICTVDPTRVRSGRQFLVLPEAALILLCLPSLVYGTYKAWKIHGRAALPVILFFLSFLLLYGSATTNLGALYRWRLQAVGLAAMLIFFGAWLRRKGFAYAMLKLLARRELRQEQSYGM